MKQIFNYRTAGLVASMQWPKDGMEFVDRIREKVETMGVDRKKYYRRIRPVSTDGRVLLRVYTTVRGKKLVHLRD
jgi:hypothetical protein